MLRITKGKNLLSVVKKELAQVYKVTDLGPAKYFLGVDILMNASGVIWLGQAGFVGTILNRFKMTDCNDVMTPMDPAQYSALTIMLPATDEERHDMRTIPYREAIGQVLYLSTSTRSDIADAVGNLSRHVSDPWKVHWEAVKRLLRYLKGTRNYILSYAAERGELVGHADADWAGGSERSSVSGNIFTIGRSLIG
jgi:Reverse transcriptase (RNA-dependent DNA polymerase)